MTAYWRQKQKVNILPLTVTAVMLMYQKQVDYSSFLLNVSFCPWV